MKKPVKTYRCYFDGSCAPINPDGAMGTGVHIISEGHEYKDSRYFPAKIGNTNNIAEYLAFMRVLRLMRDKIRCNIEIRGDSSLVINQMCGTWGIKEGAYVPYAKQAKELLSELRKKNNVTFTFIRREHNKMADELSKANKNESTHTITTP
jgi:ribonuclease HI